MLLNAANSLDSIDDANTDWIRLSAVTTIRSSCPVCLAGRQPRLRSVSRRLIVENG
jgi:hypothetical protein